MGCSELAVPAMASSYQPLELVIEILSRLPVKSILRFKSVCKNWYALIESPHFIAKHLTQSTLNSNICSNALLLIRDGKVTLLSTHFPFNKDHCLINLDFPFFNTLDVRSILGICNGLVCLKVSDSGSLILCNLATRQSREIPDNKWWDDNVTEIRWFNFGFGFSPSADDYVLIRITDYRFITGDRKPLTRTEMYMMGTDIWRDLDVTLPSALDEEIDNADFRPCGLYLYPERAVFMNGVLYWPALALPKADILIAALDLGGEVFRKIRTPFHCNLIGRKLVALKEKLAMVFEPYGLRCFEVWLLNEDQRSWTNQFRVGPFSPTSVLAGCWESGVKFVGCANNGQLIMRVDTKSGGVKLYMCDLNTQVTNDIPFDQAPGLARMSDIFMSVEILLPVKKNNES